MCPLDSIDINGQNGGSKVRRASIVNIRVEDPDFELKDVRSQKTLHFVIFIIGSRIILNIQFSFLQL